LDALLFGLEQSAIGQSMRAWRWLYPIVNTAHIFGIAMLFGALLPLHMRHFGLWKQVDTEALARVLVPVAMAGLAIAIAAGGLMFTTDARKYLGMPLFQAKVGLICFGAANALFLARRRATRRAALISLVCWTGAIICGRFIGYV
jgi:hypothetical protein